MELYDVPNGTAIRVLKAGYAEAPPQHRAFVAGEVLTFMHLDGMYSLCIDKDGKPVHLKAWAEVAICDE